MYEHLTDEEFVAAVGADCAKSINGNGETPALEHLLRASVKAGRMVIDHWVSVTDAERLTASASLTAGRDERIALKRRQNAQLATALEMLVNPEDGKPVDIKHVLGPAVASTLERHTLEHIAFYNAHPDLPPPKGEEGEHYKAVAAKHNIPCRWA